MVPSSWLANTKNTVRLAQPQNDGGIAPLSELLCTSNVPIDVQLAYPVGSGPLMELSYARLCANAPGEGGDHECAARQAGGVGGHDAVREVDEKSGRRKKHRETPPRPRAARRATSHARSRAGGDALAHNSQIDDQLAYSEGSGPVM